jgi:hypothetical protein
MDLIAYYQGSKISDQRRAVEGFCHAFQHTVICEIIDEVANPGDLSLLEPAITQAKEHGLGLIVPSLAVLGPGYDDVAKYATTGVELFVVEPMIRGWDAVLVYLSSGVLVQRDLPIQNLTPEAIDYINRTQGRCPKCQGGELLEGPHGSCSVNALCIRCGQEYCLFVNPLSAGPLVMSGELVTFADDREGLYLNEAGLPRRKLLTDWQWRVE